MSRKKKKRPSGQARIQLVPDHARQPVFSLDDRMPLVPDAIERAAAVHGSLKLAALEVIKHMRSRQLSVVSRCFRHDGRDSFEVVEPAHWDDKYAALLDDKIDPAQIHLTKERAVPYGVDADDYPRDRTQCWYFVDRKQFDQLYPDPNEARRSGRKPTHDWYTALAKWLIKVASEDSDRLRNIDELVSDAQIFLQNKIRWAPKDPKQVREKILDLLEETRRE